MMINMMTTTLTLMTAVNCAGSLIENFKSSKRADKIFFLLSAESEVLFFDIEVSVKRKGSEPDDLRRAAPVVRNEPYTRSDPFRSETVIFSAVSFL